ncbi:hypothetical protein BJY04DRAFT_12263 [Aspergillus karnatakaensis]|uniref:uncharacterized protein n=1 Tax=Aspergillus karnatakaensis TaxID=1810916 RepID=UPI003CCD8752
MGERIVLDTRNPATCTWISKPEGAQTSAAVLMDRLTPQSGLFVLVLFYPHDPCKKRWTGLGEVADRNARHIKTALPIAQCGFFRLSVLGVMSCLLSFALRLRRPSVERHTRCSAAYRLTVCIAKDRGCITKDISFCAEQRYRRGHGTPSCS